MEIIQSGFLRLSRADWIKGLLMAVATPILMYLGNAMGVPGFTFSTLDFSMLIKMGLAAGLTYIIKNFLTDSKGRVLGKIG